ncbi:MAG: putative DNA-binding domain-containing protein [Bacteroidota bacterium]|nr:putative DNA-binding domain-containing protein [Bacteroidota bacterium]
MQLSDTTASYQSKLATYCRTGKLESIPGIKMENVSHYRRLVMNVVDDMLQNAYPLTYALCNAKEWRTAVNDFFSNYSCQSPQVWYMPEEFYVFLVQTKHSLLNKYAFLEDLLLFEWTEVELFMMEDKLAIYSSKGDLCYSKLVINPEHQLLHFHYPVHKKKPQTIKEADKNHYYLIAHRNREGQVIFTDASPALVRITEYLSEANLSLPNLCLLFEKEYNIRLNQADQSSIYGFLQNALQSQLILGFSE